MTGQIRPDYIFGSCVVNAALGTFASHRGGIRAIERLGIGHYRITTDPTSILQSQIKRCPIVNTFSSVSINVSLAAPDTLIVRTSSAGVPFDIDFWLEIDTLSTPQEGEVFVPSPSPPSGQIMTQLLHLQDTRQNGVGGGAPVALSRNTRVLNTVLTNEIPGASLLNNQVTLPAGTYIVNARLPNFRSSSTRGYLHDITNGVDLIRGQNASSTPTAFFEVSFAVVYGKFVLSEETVLELQQYFQGTNVNGLGFPVAGDSGVEVYSDARFWLLS